MSGNLIMFQTLLFLLLFVIQPSQQKAFPVSIHYQTAETF